MSAKVLTPAQANVELFILNSEVEAMSSSDFYAWLKERGLPDEAAIRLKAVAEMTAEVGKRMINVGKMILIKIMEFVKAHTNLAIGVAIGAAIGALVGAIPWIGPFLAPIATLIGVSVGSLAGHKLDRSDSVRPQNSGVFAIGQDIIEIASAFFKLFTDILTLTLDAKLLRGL